MNTPLRTSMALAVAALAMAGGNSMAGQNRRKMTLDEVKQARKKAAHRPRRIIMNNDGNDARTRHDAPRTHEDFLRQRTTALAGSHVDAIFYCTGVFNSYTHHSTETELRRRGDREVLDWAWELGTRGPDSLATVVDFGHKHGIEVFWSMRMNDTHDSADPALFCQWKKDHPDYLMGKHGEKFRSGARRWSAVDYGLAPVRDKVLAILRDVATRYDVDGLELDFFRHPVYFKPQMLGKTVTQKHCDMMTSLLRRVRKMADAEGARRGRPILIAARVPDSVGYAKAIGLDVERWMQDDLVDMLVTSGYFRLCPWDTSVALCRKHGVPVYAGLSESRLRGDPARIRQSAAGYCGRAAVAWAAGVDGVYTFNSFRPASPIFRQIGDPKALATRDRVYTTGARPVRPANSWLADGLRFLERPAPLPERPATLEPGKPHTIELRVGDKPAKAGGPTPSVTLRLHVPSLPAADTLTVNLNGKPLAAGTKDKAWVEFAVDPALVRKGVNRVELTLKPGGPAKAVVKDLLLWVRHSKK